MAKCSIYRLRRKSRVRQPQNVVSTIATLMLRTMVATGDFSALGTGIFDPYSTTVQRNAESVSGKLLTRLIHGQVRLQSHDALDVVGFAAGLAGFALVRVLQRSLRL